MNEELTLPCRFAVDGSGAPAQTSRGRVRCVFCDPGFLADVMTSALKIRVTLTNTLRQWERSAPNICQLAFRESTLLMLSDDDLASLRRALVPRGTRSWMDALHQRSAVARAGKTEPEFAAVVGGDKDYVRKKMFPARQRRVRHSNTPWRHPMTEAMRATVRDVANNDTGLPAAQLSETSKNLEMWCKEGSWAVCKQCGSVQARHLKEQDTRRATRPVIKTCKNCAKRCAKRTWVPAPADVPVPLRQLDRAVLQALRPLDIDCGPEWRASGMIRFSWAMDDVEDKIEMLPAC